MKPYFQHGNITIYLGNAYTIIPQLNKNYFGTILTDPPFSMADGWMFDIEAAHYLRQSKLLDVMTEKAEAIFFTNPAHGTVRVEKKRNWLSMPWFTQLPTAKPAPWLLHPHARPLELVNKIVAQTEGRILDPFMGSGTTLLAANEQGREAVGIDICEEYCEQVASFLTFYHGGAIAA